MRPKSILGARTRILSEDIHNYILFVVLTDVRYFEKAAKFVEISVAYRVKFKSTGRFLQIFVSFSEYINFKPNVSYQ